MANCTPRLGSIKRSANRDRRRPGRRSRSSASTIRRGVGVAVQEDRRGERRLAGGIAGDRVEVGADHRGVTRRRRRCPSATRRASAPRASTSVGTSGVAAWRPSSPRGERRGTGRARRDRRRLPKNWNRCPSHARTLPSGNTPAGVVPSPERRSASGRTPALAEPGGNRCLLASPLAASSTWRRSAAWPRSTSTSRLPTITNCRGVGCLRCQRLGRDQIAARRRA